MSDLRKAAEMALEALEKLRFANAPFLDEAMEALRQALDKPEIDPQALVEIAILAEREACAKVCDTMATPETSRDAQHDFHWAAGCCAAAIRARGDK